MANTLVTPDQLTSFMSGDADGQLIDAAVNLIRRYCGWHVSPVVTQELVVDGTGGDTLYLETLALKNVVSVVNDGVAVPLENIESSRDGIIQLKSGGWSTRLGGIRITVEHGFEDAPELQALAQEMVARSKNSVGGVTGEASDGVSLQFSKFGGGAAGGIGLMQHEYETLNRYKVRGV